MARIGEEAMQHGFGLTLLKGIFAGWLIATIVWLLPFAESARAWVIIIITHVVGVAHLSHIVAGAVDVFGLGWIAENSPRNAARASSSASSMPSTLKSFPLRTVVRGRAGTGKAPVRSLPVQSWIVFFRVLEEEKVVRIVRVRHAARRRPRSFD